MFQESTDATPAVSELNTWLARFDPTSPVVVVPVYNAFEDVCECVESLLSTSPVSSPLVVVDDASTDSRLAPWGAALAAAHSDRLYYVRKATNTGFVGSCNLGFAAALPHDVVLVNWDSSCGRWCFLPMSLGRRCSPSITLSWWAPTTASLTPCARAARARATEPSRDRSQSHRPA